MVCYGQGPSKANSVEASGRSLLIDPGQLEGLAARGFRTIILGSCGFWIIVEADEYPACGCFAGMTLCIMPHRVMKSFMTVSPS